MSYSPCSNLISNVTSELKLSNRIGCTFIFPLSLTRIFIFFNLEIILFIVGEDVLYILQKSSLILLYDIFPCIAVKAINKKGAKYTLQGGDQIGLGEAEAIEYFIKDLQDYKTSKGAIQLPLDKPLPLVLITKITEFNIERNRKVK